MGGRVEQFMVLGGYQDRVADATTVGAPTENARNFHGIIPLTAHWERATL